ncbi:hypothetical protein ABEG18_19295 [Alsobacter sp. KACC 23698]|uniref:Nucleotidyl transferase AbiEii/AbiGii toxin family protein n=1 Tax=Alsobacter sp. KACC 23698 TaxID=3149229 RepID=A0AAU7JC49_9HYPH
MLEEDLVSLVDVSGRPRWTLDMALAWIVTRDLQAVRLLWEEFRIEEMGLPFSGTFDLDLFDIAVPEQDFAKAGRALLAALRKGQVSAYDISEAGVRREIDPLRFQDSWRVGRTHTDETVICDASGARMVDVQIASSELMQVFPPRITGVEPNVFPNRPVPAARVIKRSNKVDPTVEALRVLYPNRPPVGVNRETLRRAVNAHFRSSGMPGLEVQLATIDRALAVLRRSHQEEN